MPMSEKDRADTHISRGRVESTLYLIAFLTPHTQEREEVVCNAMAVREGRSLQSRNVLTERDLGMHLGNFSEAEEALLSI